MTNESPFRFILNNGTNVIVKKVTNIKYDFELLMVNGSRKTFLWTEDTPFSFADRNGNTDITITEAVNKFITIQHS